MYVMCCLEQLLKYASLATLNNVAISEIQSNSQIIKCMIGLIIKSFNALFVKTLKNNFENIIVIYIVQYMNHAWVISPSRTA